MKEEGISSKAEEVLGNFVEEEFNHIYPSEAVNVSNSFAQRVKRCRIYSVHGNTLETYRGFEDYFHWTVREDLSAEEKLRGSS